MCGLRSFFFSRRRWIHSTMPSDITRLLNHGIVANSEYAVPVDVTQTPPLTTVIPGPCRDVSTMVVLEKIEIPTAFSFLFTIRFLLQHGSNVCIVNVCYTYVRVYFLFRPAISDNFPLHHPS